MLMLVREHDLDQKLLEQDAEERVRRGVTFREVATAYLEWLERVRGAKPSTLRDHRSVLSEPGRPHRRGAGLSPGRAMAALGDRPAREISTREIEVLLISIGTTGVAPRTVNKARALICSVFSYGMRPSVFGLAENPARFADRRAEPQQATLAFYSPEQVEALARSLTAGTHRERSLREVSPEELAVWRGEFTSPDDYVFANRLGRRLDASALRRRFERARGAAGLEPLRFHDLRHTYGSLLVAGGIDLASVRRRWVIPRSRRPSATFTPGRRVSLPIDSRAPSRHPNPPCQ